MDPARIRLLRDVALCQSQDDFAKALGVAKRTIGNAERGAHSPSLALRRALDQALQHASDVQRDRFHAAVAAHHTTTSSPTRIREAVAPGHPNGALDGLRSAVLGTPAAIPIGGAVPLMPSPRAVMAATVQAHRLYQMADYDGAAQLLPDILTCLQSVDDAVAVLHLLESGADTQAMAQCLVSDDEDLWPVEPFPAVADALTDGADLFALVALRLVRGLLQLSEDGLHVR